MFAGSDRGDRALLSGWRGSHQRGVFYDTVLGVLGFSRQMDFGVAIGYGRDGKPSFWISDGSGMGPNREVHLAFEAADEDAVHAFHEATSKRSGTARLRARNVAGMASI